MHKNPKIHKRKDCPMRKDGRFERFSSLVVAGVCFGFSGWVWGCMFREKGSEGSVQG